MPWWYCHECLQLEPLSCISESKSNHLHDFNLWKSIRHLRLYMSQTEFLILPKTRSSCSLLGSKSQPQVKILGSILNSSLLSHSIPNPSANLIISTFKVRVVSNHFLRCLLLLLQSKSTSFLTSLVTLLLPLSLFSMFSVNNQSDPITESDPISPPQIF